jgi:hypothetical protein
MNPGEDIGNDATQDGSPEAEAQQAENAGAAGAPPKAEDHLYNVIDH